MDQIDNVASDLLKGARAISEFTGLSEREVYYLASRKLLPLFKIGDGLYGRKSTLRSHFDKLEAAGAN